MNAEQPTDEEIRLCYAFRYFEFSSKTLLVARKDSPLESEFTLYTRALSQPELITEEIMETMLHATAKYLVEYCQVDLYAHLLKLHNYHSLCEGQPSVKEMMERLRQKNEGDYEYINLAAAVQVSTYFWKTKGIRVSYQAETEEHHQLLRQQLAHFKPTDECAICFEQLGEAPSAITLSTCGHHWHSACIKSWTHSQACQDGPIDSEWHCFYCRRPSKLIERNKLLLL